MKKMNKVENAIYHAFYFYKIDKKDQLIVTGNWADISAAIKKAMKRKPKK